MRNSEIIQAIQARPFADLAEGDLRGRLSDLRSLPPAPGLHGGLEPDTLLTTFCLVYEAIRRKLSFRATEEQVLAGLLLWRGKVVEMNAGEGKTLAAAFPAALHTAAGRSVHVITANDYLAVRDAETLAPVYESLGLTVSAVAQSMNDDERRSAYGANIVYGTVRELGFDFLRDNLRYSESETVQGKLDAAIIDEADQALIDEAATPLIISGEGAGNRRGVHKADAAVREMVALQRRISDSMIEKAHADLPTGSRRRLLAALFLADPESEYLTRLAAGDPKLARRIRADAADAIELDGDSTRIRDLYYYLDAEGGAVTLTDRGHRFVESRLGPIFDTGGLEAGVERVRADAELGLVERRRSSERLGRRIARMHARANQVHQALRAHLLLRRGVDYVVSDGAVALVDEVTGRRKPGTRYQHGLHAALETKERLPLTPERGAAAQISIQGFLRQYANLCGMTGTALSSRDEIRRAYGLDVVSVPTTFPSQRVDLPSRVFVSHDEKMRAVVEEVEECRRAGRPALVGALTVEQSEEISSTLQSHGIPHRVLNAVNSADEEAIVSSAGRRGAVTVATNMAGRGADIVPEPSLGLHVIGTEVNAARRIDDQLRGRAGRQGQPGTTRFILSLEDKALAGRLQVAGDGGIERAQLFSTLDDEARRGVLADYYRALEGQTLAYYGMRRSTMTSNGMYEECIQAARDAAREVVDERFGADPSTDYERRFDEMASAVSLDFGVDCEELWGLGVVALRDGLEEMLARRVNAAREMVGKARFDEIARVTLLQAGDGLWSERLVLLQDMMIGAALTASSHASAVADFQRGCIEEYDSFLRETRSVFLRKLLAVVDSESHFTTGEDARVEGQGAELRAELSAILA